MILILDAKTVTSLSLYHRSSYMMQFYLTLDSAISFKVLIVF